MEKQNEELLEAALKLAESIRPYSLSEEERTLIEVIEQHRTEPERVEGWLNIYKGYEGYRPGGIIWPTEEEAKQNCGINGVRQVHIREVVPVEWEPWIIQTLLDFPHYQAIIDAHNAEMERVIAKIGE